MEAAQQTQDKIHSLETDSELPCGIHEWICNRTGEWEYRHGASPQGETIGIYEDTSTRSDTQEIIEEIRQDRLLDKAITQYDFDAFLQWKQNNSVVIIVGRFRWHSSMQCIFLHHGSGQIPDQKRREKFPRLCLNILNGGRPCIYKPGPQWLLGISAGAKYDNVDKVMADHAEIQQEVKAGLARCERIVINQNPVHRFRTRDNKECLVFLQ